MEGDQRQQVLGAVRLTLIVLGIGLLASLLVGLVVGWIIDDMARGLGRTVAIGMGAAAIAGVALNVIPRGR